MVCTAIDIFLLSVDQTLYKVSLSVATIFRQQIVAYDANYDCCNCIVLYAEMQTKRNAAYGA